MKNRKELCIRNQNEEIVAWNTDHSEQEIEELLASHKEDGWHRSCVECVEESIIGLSKNFLEKKQKFSFSHQC
jgi:hypothetical protein